MCPRLRVAILVVASIVTLSHTASAQSIDMTGTWEIAYSGQKYVLTFQQHASKFTGSYFNNPSLDNNIFTGEVYESDRGAAIFFVQSGTTKRDGSSPREVTGASYYALYVGHVAGRNRVTGCWTDVEGNKADFTMTKR